MTAPPAGIDDDSAARLRAAEPARAGSGTGRTAGDPVQPCPLANRDWIEIQLVGEDDAGIADEAYIIIDASGTEWRGKTDQRGWARVDGLPPGACRICFPDMDTETWQFVRSGHPL